MRKEIGCGDYRATAAAHAEWNLQIRLDALENIDQRPERPFVSSELQNIAEVCNHFQL